MSMICTPLSRAATARAKVDVPIVMVAIDATLYSSVYPPSPSLMADTGAGFVGVCDVYYLDALIITTCH